MQTTSSLSLNAITPASEAERLIQKAPHYNQALNPLYEVILVLRAWGLERDALLWNVVKYIARGYFKGNLLQDLKKARYYLDARIQRLEETQPVEGAVRFGVQP